MCRQREKILRRHVLRLHADPMVAIIYLHSSRLGIDVTQYAVAVPSILCTFDRAGTFRRLAC
jgi:hypothetical protein